MNRLLNLDVVEISILSKGTGPAVPDALVALMKQDDAADVGVAKALAGKMAEIEDRLEVLAKAHAEAHAVTLAQAYEAVVSTPEGKALYAAASAAHDKYQHAMGARAA